jgi:molybdopterin converting factor small subunit
MPQSISVRVRLFASLREAAGASHVALQVPASTPVGALWGHLSPEIGADEPPAGLRYALNHEWTLPGAPLRDGDEVALVLPVSGG